jgi:GntR family transcriptional regulator
MISLPTTGIDRSSPVPFWFQLARVLEQAIASGLWRPGERLASESELCDHFGISRTTVRQALARLEQEGMVVRRKGFGTFATSAGPRMWLVQSQEGFYHDDVFRLGRAVSSQMLRRELTELPSWAATALSLPVGARGVVMERLRSVDGNLALVVTDCLPERLAGTVLGMDGGDSLYQRLKDEHRLEVAGGRRFLEAVTAGEKLGRMLDVEASAPLVFIESVSWDSDMRPFHCYRSWLRTDRMRVEVQVSTSVAPPEAPPRAGESPSTATDRQGEPR